VPKGVLEFLDSLELSLQNLNTFWEQHGEEILAIFTRLSESFGATVLSLTGTTGQTLGQLMEDFTGNLVENGDDVVQSMDDIALKIEKDFLPALEDVAQYFVDNPEVVKNFAELGVKLKILGAVIDKIKGPLIILGALIALGLGPIAALILAIGLLVIVYTFAKDKLEALGDQLEIIFGEINKRIEKWRNDMSADLQGFADDVSKGFERMKDEISATIANLFGIALVFLTLVLITVARIVSIVFTTILNFIGSLIPELDVKLQEVITAIEDIDWAQLGKDIVSGIVKGIQESEGLVATLVAMARNALNAVLEFFGQAPIGGGGGGGGQRKTKTGGGGGGKVTRQSQLLTTG
jgi:hypothetical protein